MARPRILIVEDEQDIADLVLFHVERGGLEGEIVNSGRTALEQITTRRPDLVLLDLMLPDLDGLEVCRQLRWKESTRDLPVIMLTARGEEADIVAGIELGADDYVTKPFSPKVLMARIKSVLRRAGGHEQAPEDSRRLRLANGAVLIDHDRHTVEVDGELIELTLTEFGILGFLGHRPGFVRTREQIIQAVHGSNTVLSSRTIDVHVTALRRKLGSAGRLIETVRGVGYRLRESGHDAE